MSPAAAPVAGEAPDPDAIRADLAAEPAGTVSEDDIRNTPQAMRREAELLRRAGLAVLRRLPPKLDENGEPVADGKAPGITGWSERSCEPDEFQPEDGLSIMPGWLSEVRPDHYLVVIDLDRPEAVGRWREFLPPTPMLSGRKSKPIDRLYYLIPVASIPPHLRADVTGSGLDKKSVAAAYRAGKHPGMGTFGFSLPRENAIGKGNNTGLEVFRVQGTGGQSISPPTVHKSGEQRKWYVAGVGPVESFADVAAAGVVPAVVDLAELAAACVKFAEATGAFNKDLRPAPRPEKPAGGSSGSRGAGKRGRVKETRETVRLTPEVEIPVTRYEWPGWEKVPDEDRERRCRAYLRGLVRDGGLPRSQQNGHNRTFRIANIVANDFALFQDREKCRAILEEEINTPLTALGDGWGASELAHKLDGAVAKVGRDEEHPLGAKLRTVPKVLRNWMPITPEKSEAAAKPVELVRYEFGRMKRDGVTEVRAYRCKDKSDAGKLVGSENASPWSETGREKLVKALKLSASQVLYMGEVRKPLGDAATKTFWSDEFPADLGVEVEAQTDTVGRSLAAITDDALLMLDDDLQAASGLMFRVIDGKPAYLDRAPQLFSYVGGVDRGAESNIDWREGPTLWPRGEFFEHVRGAVPQYDAVAACPFYPPVSGVFHTRAAPGPGDGATLDKLVSFYNPATPEDRVLIKAMFASPAWGGPGGARPMYMIEGDEDDAEGGRGLGKTTLAEHVSQLYGGDPVAVKEGERVEDLESRLLSPGGEDCRVVLWDNVKSLKMSNGDFEGLATRSSISGWRPYHGNWQRPNRLLYVVTKNGGTLSKDLSQRACVVRLKRPDRDPGWEHRVEEFIDRNRDALFADVAAVVERAPQVSGSGGYSRWARWEAEVIAGCCQDAAEFARVLTVLQERRDAADGDDLDAQTAEGELRKLVVGRDGEGADEAGVVELDAVDLNRISVELFGQSGGRGKGGRSANLTTLTMKCRGEVPQLVSKRSNGTHYFWVGDGHPDAARLRRTGKNAPLAGELRAAAAAYTQSRQKAKPKAAGAGPVPSWFGAPTVNQ